MTPREFKRKIKRLAKAMPHSTLADTLNIKTSRLQNWLYKDDLPDDFAVRALAPIVEVLWVTRINKPKPTTA